MMLVVGFGDALAKGVQPRATDKPLQMQEQRLLYDPPSRPSDFQRFAVDTIWWGAYNTVSRAAIRDSVWTFENGTLEGWTSEDLTNIGTWFRRRTRANFAGDPVIAVVGTPATSNASLWVGRHTAETTSECWPGGMGYGNGWGMHATKVYPYSGTSSVTMTFKYFVDSEEQFDFTYVYVTAGAQTVGPLNTSAHPNPLNKGYSGSVQEGTNIGTPTVPANGNVVIDAGVVQGQANFEVDWNFDSDPLFSDQIDSSGSFLNTQNGAFGIDDINMDYTGGPADDLDNFEATAEGWAFAVEPSVGTYMQVVDFDFIQTLNPIADPCACPLQLDTTNDFVMIAADISDPGVLPFHPKKHREELRSPAAYIGAAGDRSRPTKLIRWQAYNDLVNQNGVGYRQAMHYYPWTCTITGVVGWTVEPAGDGGFAFFDPPDCNEYLVDNSGFIPANTVDSLKIIFEVLGDCDDFGVTDCTGPQGTNPTPYIDRVRLGLAGLDVNAPLLSIDLTYQDVFPGNSFPSVQTLLPNATAQVHAYHDCNRADQDPTNAHMGDSIVVIGAPNTPFVHIFLNYRVWPGPAMSTGAGTWWAREYQTQGGDLPVWSNGTLTNKPNWVEVEMDTIQIASPQFPQGVTQSGKYATYVNERETTIFTSPETGAAFNWKYNPANKVIEDGALTPGSQIEYFFSTCFASGTNPNYPGAPRAVFPDTAGSFFLEFEVLPGYFRDNSVIKSPCLLYVDATTGAQVPIEKYGFTPYLGGYTYLNATYAGAATPLPGTIDDVGRMHDNWDRYDYTAAGSNVPAPLARESAGDNGMSKYQSMVYRWVLYNTGQLSDEGLRDGDARLLQNFLLSDDFGRSSIRKGLWLSGNGIASILYRPGRADNNVLASNFGEFTLPDPDPYRLLTGDESYCVKLDADSDRDFPASDLSYSSVIGNGCPSQLSYQVIQPRSGTGSKGNLVYVNQDGGGTVTENSSVSSNEFIAGRQWGVVTDSYSLHFQRLTPDNFSGDGTTACTDSVGITRRVENVFDWFQVDAAVLCDTTGLIIDVGDPSAGPAIARTMLFQNAPNPFNPQTTVRYQLAEKSHVKLQIFDVSGKLVRTLVDGVQARNTYSVKWDGTNQAGTVVSSGVYWARMVTSTGFKASTKMVVLK
jgi:hypothetical protein